MLKIFKFYESNIYRTLKREIKWKELRKELVINQNEVNENNFTKLKLLPFLFFLFRNNHRNVLIKFLNQFWSKSRRFIFNYAYYYKLIVVSFLKKKKKIFLSLL